jgi:hypothetical protein
MFTTTKRPKAGLKIWAAAALQEIAPIPENCRRHVDFAGPISGWAF